MQMYRVVPITKRGNYAALLCVVYAFLRYVSLSRIES